MSTYFDLECVEHGEKAGIHWNHGDRELAFVARYLSAWAPLGQMFMVMAATQEIGSVGWVSGIGDDCNPFTGAEYGPTLEKFAMFAARHESCTVKPRDEYGRWYDQCWKHVTCGDCQTSHPCALSRDHDGGCQRKA